MDTLQGLFHMCGSKPSAPKKKPLPPPPPPPPPPEPEAEVKIGKEDTDSAIRSRKKKSSRRLQIPLGGAGRSSTGSAKTGLGG